MQKFVVLIVFLGLLALPLMAQKAEVFGGYQYLRLGSDNSNNGTGNAISFNGWDTSVTGYFNKFFGVTGDFSGNYATVNGANVHIYSYTGGPVVGFREGRVNPFVHVLFGGAHVSVSESAQGATVSVSKNGFTTLFGGGVDVKVNRAVAVRLAEFDWVYYHFSDLNTSNDNVRLTTGIVFRF
jgi:hypothetical protein